MNPQDVEAATKNFYYFSLFSLFSFIPPYVSCFMNYAFIFIDAPPFDCKGKAHEWMGMPCTLALVSPRCLLCRRCPIKSVK